VEWDDGEWIVEDSVPINTGPGCDHESWRRVECGVGVDRLVVTAGDGDDTVTNWSFLAASLDGGAGNDTLYGGGASDTLEGGPGTDNLYGSFGDDLLRGRTGADRLSGGSGHDTVDYSARTAPLRVDPDDRADDGEAGEGDDVRTDVEAAQLGAGNDTYIGNSLANHVTGGAGSDTLQGGDGDDGLDGEDGLDSYSAGAGADTVNSRDGFAEDVSCGASADIAFVDPADHTSDCEQVNTAGVAPPVNPEPGPAPAPGPGDGSSLLQGLELVPQQAPLPVTPSGALTLTVQCLADTVGGCRGTLTLELPSRRDAAASRRGRRRLGRRSFRVDPGHAADVKVRISRRGRRMIARKRKARVRARIETQTASGTITTFKTVRVKASRRGRPKKQRGR
jgi:Ca2+-binding RTX toxin-like protein